ncbi:AbiH family protein [Paraglaciecola chathamensis]|uniref:Bacteriophage abortive infection AbiH n=1 Tax=Paraglaciecola chathamensis S18K6 TaxID=1127672 RepID=A0AAV3V2T6_9ALTE|nr:AbiH family protein [Paraglaciecola chathamensis]GAC11037.1 hypothetical protein GCHA_3096 [Paraglaciecola chathamensis S18K6]
MKVVYLIGNGFDINLGLKTKYSDFFKYYMSQEENDSAVLDFKKRLKADLDEDGKLWADLELKFGSYMNQLSTLEEFDSVHGNIIDKLALYLKGIQQDSSKNGITSIDHDLFFEHLFHPENFITHRDKISLQEYYKTIRTVPNYFDIISFNYTNTIESILGLEDGDNFLTGLNFKRITGQVDYRLNSICHVHGSVVENMVLGVNDTTQIENKGFQNNIDITDQIVKSKCNLAQRHGLESTCERTLEQADLICIFGSSMGETDQIWWDKIANELTTRNCRLVIFEYNELIDPLKSQRAERLRREVVKRLFRNSLDQDISNKVFISYNSKMFDLLKI